MMKLFYLVWMVVKRGRRFDFAVFGLAGLLLVLSLLSLNFIEAAFFLVISVYVLWSVIMRGQD